MAQISPYLHFNDKKCKEAMNFYKGFLGGELTLMTVAESPMAKDMPAESQDNIMHAALKGTVELFGSDMMRDRAIVGDSVTVSLVLDSNEEMKKVFDGLSAGGEVFMPIDNAFWGGTFGVVTDKYGIEWMLTYPQGKI